MKRSACGELRPRLALLWGAAACLAASPVAVLAQGTGTTAGIILEIPASARAMGLAGATTAVLGDAATVFTNPSGMAVIRRIAMDGSWEQSQFGTTYTSAALAGRVGRFHLGFGAALLDFGGDPVVVPDPLNGDSGVATGSVIDAYQALGVGALSYRRGLLSLGASVKGVREHIGDGTGNGDDANGITGDVGIAAALFDIAALSFVVQNVAGGMRAAGLTVPLPRTTRVGFAIQVVDPQGPTRLLSSTEYVAPPGGDGYWVFAFEGGVVVWGVGVVGRTGFVAGAADTDRGTVFGGSLVFHSLRIDWAMQPFGVLDTQTQRFGVRWTP